MVVAAIGKAFTKVFGSRNERLLKNYRRRVLQINALEPQMRRLTDAELKAKTSEFRKRIADGERVADVMPEIMAAAREAMDRNVGIRNIFDPAKNFDPTKLTGEVRATFDRIAAEAATIPPIEELGHNTPVPGWQQVEIPIAVYEAVRELYPQSRPPFRARPFDVQLIGGMVLGEGRIAEMKTGEGKTIVAPLACYVACVENLQCHVVTVNDYLVQRDRDWVFPFYFHMGLRVGAIHPYHMQSNEKKAEAYLCDVVYGTNSEFGFDYLRDNMKLSSDEQVQKRRDFCIVDEIDSILIDEARTPLIISGPAHDDAPRYDLADTVSRHLLQKQRQWDAADGVVQQATMRIKGLEGDIRNSRDKERSAQMREEMKALQAKLPDLEAARDRHIRYYEIEREKKAAHLTHEGIAEAQKVANIGSFYVGANMDFPHLLENSLRAHTVYQRDKEYVVEGGEVIIVDEFTGRKMIGRQWSDGLHQAVEAKEGVKIKQETQTLATVTIQNFFKLYHRLAGMTGTAITEATEFYEIYKLDVVCIPTNMPVARIDRDDLVFLSIKDKDTAILDEIKKMHDVGRPVLVGTTSVEKSQALSDKLNRKHGIKHEVLNAKQHEREAQIVEHAGELGAVMIATNMAGRGTDIKLQPIKREDLLRHWQLRGILAREAKPEMNDEQILSLAYKHMAKVYLGSASKQIDPENDGELRLALLRHWVAQEMLATPEETAKLSREQAEAMLDRVPGFLFHRLRIYQHVEEMGGLHIVGTERHEARRIDNQLRGRSGRQGDRGSSRFFIALEDDLMQMFAGKVTLNALSRLGMKEGDAIEHRWITRSVERAQRKVEERNYEIRKNLLEYDEVMEHQRNAFYSLRQNVLDGRGVNRVIFEYISDAVNDATETYLDKDYVASQISEWVRSKIDVAIETYKLRGNDADDLIETVRSAARDEVRLNVDVTLGEYMSNDLPPEEWDLHGLSTWAKGRFGVELRESQLRTMNIGEVKKLLVDAALEQADKVDLSEVTKFLDQQYAVKDLAAWTKQKFEFDLPIESLDREEGENPSTWKQRVAKTIIEKASAMYRRREIEYPIETTLDTIFAMAQTNGPLAAQQLTRWANMRYELGWTPESVAKLTGNELRATLTSSAEAWADGRKLSEVVDRALAEHKTAEALATWAQQRFGARISAADLSDHTKWREELIERGRRMHRAELTFLERFLLLQILDQAWKDHLYAMDQLKDSVGLRYTAEQDPRIEYKKEGANLFRQMQRVVRDRVTELIFRARITANAEVRNVYGTQKAQKAQAISATEAAAVQATAQQQADLDAAQAAGDGEAAAAALSRKQRRAAASAKDESSEDRPQFKKRKK